MEALASVHSGGKWDTKSRMKPQQWWCRRVRLSDIVVQVSSVLEASERIIRFHHQVVEKNSSHVVVCTLTPLASTALRHSRRCESTTSRGLLRLTDGIIDESLHADCAHGIEEMLSSRGTGFGWTGAAHGALRVVHR